MVKLAVKHVQTICLFTYIFRRIYNTFLHVRGLNQLTEDFAALRSADPMKACEDLSGVPLHEGAARYYREIGLIE